MTRPVIGLSGRRKLGAAIVDWPAVLRDIQIDLYIADYSRAVLAAGGLPLHIPLDVAPADALDAVDGLLFSGGADIDPDRYGAHPETDAFPPEPDRDEQEFGLFAGALARELPVLGICRGLQIANVALGGSLHQDVPPHAGFEQPPTTELHEVVTAEGSTLRSLYGERVGVNSLHHQTVDRIGDQLVVTARAPDGTVEGLEHTSLPVVTVQWHPEMMRDAATDPIFAWLIAAAR